MKVAMAPDTGLRTSRRISHVFVMDTPAYARTLLITDAAINIEPQLEDKIHIVQNAIDLAHALGIPEPKVALLSAIETVNPKIKGLVSPVTGQADILVVPDLESGNMLAKQLEYLGGAQLAGIVLGARVP